MSLVIPLCSGHENEKLQARFPTAPDALKMRQKVWQIVEFQREACDSRLKVDCIGFDRLTVGKRTLCCMRGLFEGFVCRVCAAMRAGLPSSAENGSTNVVRDFFDSGQLSI